MKESRWYAHFLANFLAALIVCLLIDWSHGLLFDPEPSAISLVAALVSSTLVTVLQRK